MKNEIKYYKHYSEYLKSSIEDYLHGNEERGIQNIKEYCNLRAIDIKKIQFAIWIIMRREFDNCYM